MGVDQRLAPIELLPDRCEGSVAEIFVLVARHQAHTVGLERVERVFDFLETALRVEQRNGRETGKAARVVPCELRTELVAEARHSPSFLDVRDRKSTRLNSSHRTISYAVFCLKKKTILDHELL